MRIMYALLLILLVGCSLIDKLIDGCETDEDCNDNELCKDDICVAGRRCNYSYDCNDNELCSNSLPKTCFEIWGD